MTLILQQIHIPIETKIEEMSVLLGLEAPPKQRVEMPIYPIASLIVLPPTFPASTLYYNAIIIFRKLQIKKY